MEIITQQTSKERSDRKASKEMEKSVDMKMGSEEVNRSTVMMVMMM
jgi:hypothetical protein